MLATHYLKVYISSISMFPHYITWRFLKMCSSWRRILLSERYALIYLKLVWNIQDDLPAQTFLATVRLDQMLRKTFFPGCCAAKLEMISSFLMIVYYTIWSSKLPQMCPLPETWNVVVQCVFGLHMFYLYINQFTEKAAN